MKKILAILLSCCVLLTACSTEKKSKKDKKTKKDEVIEVVEKKDSSKDFDVKEQELYSIEDLKNNASTSDMYFTDIPIQRAPKKLLVVLMNYKSDYLVGDDETNEKIWADYIFGSPDNEEGQYSVNDYFLEVSKGQFYYEPVLLGDNETGVYSFHLDKEYSYEQGLHSDYSFFEFSYDGACVLSELADMGLNIDDFKVVGINKNNYYQILIDYSDAPQSERPSEWFETDTIMFVFPTFNMESTDLTPITSRFDTYGLYTHINYDSAYGTFVHELCHTLGAIDVYRFDWYDNDLMSCGYDQEDTFTTAHMDPYYKLLWGWTDVQLGDESGDYILYPQSSLDYAPILIPTDDPNQYFLVEYRDGTGFDNYLDENLIGVTIWRIDKLSLEQIYYTGNRAGIHLEAILTEGQSASLFYYDDKENIEGTITSSAGIDLSVEYQSEDYVIVSIKR